MMGERMGRGGPRHRGFGPPVGEFGPPGPGFGGPRWGRGPGRGGRMRRGDIRTAVLAILVDRPAHGYEIIQTLEERSGGAWRPSPGSVYPMLQLLEDEGLVRSSENEGKKVFELTDTGREEAATRLEEAGGPPWEQTGRGGSHGELRDSLVKLHMAAQQVGRTATPEQAERAAEILRQARRELYQLLAED
jgi:DNA-binding PadR family transcriptional regulator